MDSHKNPNLETTHNHHRRHSTLPSSPSQDLKVLIKNLEGSSSCAADGNNEYGVNIMRESRCLLALALVAGEDDDDDDDDERSRSQQAAEASRRKMVQVDDDEEMSSGRERLKRHRVEMAGRVWIPDIWGQEDLLKNWIDCTVFDSSLNKTTILSATKALIQQAATSTQL